MGLSVKNLSELIAPENSYTIDLDSQHIHCSTSDQTLSTIEIDPLFIFLRGIGFKKVQFNACSKSDLARWSERIQSYEQLYIEDPESLVVSNCKWHELNESQQLVVECTLDERRDLHEFSGQSVVPPFKAPLGVTEEARINFIEEISNESPKDTIKRFFLITQEYFKEDSLDAEQELLEQVVKSLLLLSFEFHCFDIIQKVREKYSATVGKLLNNRDFLKESLEKSEPLPGEFFAWADFFKPTPYEHLISLLNEPSIERRISKVLQMRSLEDPEGVINIFFNSSLEIQKKLFSTLCNHFTVHHVQRLLDLMKEIKEPSFKSNLMSQAIKLHSQTALKFCSQSYFSGSRFGSQKVQSENYLPIINAIEAAPKDERVSFLKKHLKRLDSHGQSIAKKLLLKWENDET